MVEQLHLTTLVTQVKKNDRLLAAGTSEEAFDTEYRKGIYNEWQALMVEDVPVAPTVYRYATNCS